MREGRGEWTVVYITWPAASRLVDAARVYLVDDKRGLLARVNGEVDGAKRRGRGRGRRGVLSGVAVNRAGGHGGSDFARCGGREVDEDRGGRVALRLMAEWIAQQLVGAPAGIAPVHRVVVRVIAGRRLQPIICT